MLSRNMPELALGGSWKSCKYCTEYVYEVVRQYSTSTNTSYDFQCPSHVPCALFSGFDLSTELIFPCAPDGS